MSVAICSAPLLHPIFPISTSFLSEIIPQTPPQKFPIETNQIELEKQKFNICNINSQILQSSFPINQKNISICTENLGSETGSDEFSSNFDSDFFSPKIENFNQKHISQIDKKDPHYCSIARRFSLQSFPPPLPSISRRDGPCIKMQMHRRDGRLVVEAVAAPPVNILRAERRDGRLLLSFMNTKLEQKKNEVEDDTEDDEEVQILDRGATVEVKVNKPVSVNSRRSTLVINKFVGGGSGGMWTEKMICSAGTTEGFQCNYLANRHVSRWGPREPKRGTREELLRRPLFIFEPVCWVATS